MRCRLAPILTPLALVLLLAEEPRPCAAAQAMDEVWFPAGVIRWQPTQTTPEIEAGFVEAMDYYATRTPLQVTRVSGVAQGGLAPSGALGALEVRYSEGVFNYAWGGQTKHYRKPGQGTKMVKVSFETVKTRTGARTTLAHEMGHVLGFTHEFQRWDRTANGVSVPAKPFGSGGVLGDYFYNYERPNRKNVRVLSPYDLESRFATGYNATVSPNHNGPTDGNLLSAHDVNAIYRIYGSPLGAVEAGLLYGEALAAGDFDGDGFEDLAVAAGYSEPGADEAAIYFYRGVAQAPEEDGTGTTYVGWFRELVNLSGVDDRTVVLATGDSHSMPDAVSAVPAADGIDELYIGLPGAGRVEIWVVNSPGRFADGLGTTGGHGIGHRIVISAADVGIGGGAPYRGFGTSLATGRFFAGNGDDLAIGAPLGGGRTTTLSSAASRFGVATPVSQLGHRPPAVFLLPDADPGRALELADPSEDANSDFGQALAVLEDFDKGHDVLVVGAPGTDDRGEVHVYGRAYYDGTGSAVAPSPKTSFTGSTTESRFGNALAAFRTREQGGDAEHWIAVGAPKANIAGQRSGAVQLHGIDYAGNHPEELRMIPGTRNEGMNFGQEIAVHRGSCTDGLCPRGRTWIAVGSPRAEVDGLTTGQVHLWDVWTGTEPNRQAAATFAGANDDARYGQDLVAIRGTEKGGGFLMAGKRAQVPVVDGAGVRKVDSGMVHVRLNRAGHGDWDSWVLGLSPATGGDTAPDNR